MKYLYRAHALREDIRYGVIGDPIGHSLIAIAAQHRLRSRRKVDAVYLPFLDHQLRDFLSPFPTSASRGFSVTLSAQADYSQASEECEPLAADIGAVNTVLVRRDGSLYGCNTITLACLRALEKKSASKAAAC